MGLRLILIIFSIFVFQIFYSDSHSFMFKNSKHNKEEQKYIFS